MKVAEISEKLFFEEFLPQVTKDYYEVLPYFAAGLVGEGSECFGYEDDLSIDHDFGAGFSVWLPKEQYEKYGKSLEQIMDRLPDEYLSVKRKNVQGRTGVFEIEDFYKRLTGKDCLSLKNEDWLSLTDSSLATAVNGKVFMDNFGKFSEIRDKLLGFYPDDVCRYKMARACAIAGQIGQYNYLRNLDRKEYVSLQVMRGRFFENIMQIIFLINKQYMPYYKWAPRRLMELPLYGMETYKLLNELSGMADGEECFKKMYDICAFTADAMRSQDYSDNPSDFLMDQSIELQKSIKDMEIKKRGTSLVF